MARNPRNAAPAAGGNGPPAVPPPPVRPPRQPGDWTDDRTPNDELFFPNAANTANVHPNAVPSAAATARVRGGRNYTPITYGNLVSEATTYLDDVGNTIDNAHKPRVGIITLKSKRSSESNESHQEIADHRLIFSNSAYAAQISTKTSTHEL